MTEVFVDTVAWITLLNRDDAWHGDARARMAALEQHRGTLITTEFVLVEVADALAAPSIRRQTIRFIEGLRRQPQVVILSAMSSLLDEAWTLYGQRSDKGWGLTDCTSFVAMQRRGISTAFTSDRHFAQAGFTLLLQR